MNYIIEINSIHETKWGESASDFSDYNIYQTWAYQKARALKSSNKLSSFLIRDIEDNNRIICMGIVRIKRILNYNIGYVQSGPLIYSNTKINYEELFINFKKVLCLLNLNILRLNFYNCTGYSENFNTAIENANIKKSVHYRKNSTFIIDLNKDEDELMASIHRDNRRLIKKAIKNKNIDIEYDNKGKYLKDMHRMYLDAKKRKGFSGVDSDIFLNCYNDLSQNERFEIIAIKHNNIPIAIHATSHLGNTAMPLINVNSIKSLEMKISNYIWWLAYLRAKEIGILYYDMGGYDKETNPHGYLFKKRMGGQPHEYSTPFDIFHSRLSELIWQYISKKYYK